MPEGVHLPRRPYGTDSVGHEDESWEDTMDRLYDDGYEDGYIVAKRKYSKTSNRRSRTTGERMYANAPAARSPPKQKRKLSDWNKFVKANSKKKQFRYASGKVNLKKLGVAYRKKKRGRR